MKNYTPKRAPHEWLVIVLLLISGLFSARSTCVANDGVSLDDFDVAQFYRRRGIWVIPVTVGGKSSLAVLGTGSNIAGVQLSATTDSLARSFVAEPLTGTNSVLFKSVPYRFLNLPESQTDILGFEMPGMSEAVGVPLAGIAGLPCYAAHAISLNGQSGDVKVLRSPVRGISGTKIEMHVEMNKAYLPVTFPVVGSRLHLLETFDTGSLTLTEDRVRALQRMGHVVLAPGSEETKWQDGSTSTRSDTGYILRWCEIGGIRFQNVDVVIGDKDKIGLGLLRSFRCTADFPEGVVWLESLHKAEENHFSPPGCAVHFNLTPDGRLVVDKFYDDLPEQRHGLHLQDSIVSIDGKKSGELTFLDLSASLAQYGSSIDLQVEREGQVFPVSLKLEVPKNWPPQWRPEKTASLSGFEQFLDRDSSRQPIQ